jgi:hypothetical protein
LSDRKTRNALTVELDELESFCSAYGHFENPARELLELLKEAQPLVIVHEQLGAIERVAEKLERIVHDKFSLQKLY